MCVNENMYVFYYVSVHLINSIFMELVIIDLRS